MWLKKCWLGHYCNKQSWMPPFDEADCCWAMLQGEWLEEAVGRFTGFYYIDCARKWMACLDLLSGFFLACIIINFYRCNLYCYRCFGKTSLLIGRRQDERCRCFMIVFVKINQVVVVCF